MIDYEPRVATLAQHWQLIALLAQLTGDTPELFQDQALLKPPLIGREKPWHQDNAYFNVPPETSIVGVALLPSLPTEVGPVLDRIRKSF